MVAMCVLCGSVAKLLDWDTLSYECYECGECFCLTQQTTKDE